MKLTLTLFSFCFFAFLGSAQDDTFVTTVEQSLAQYYAEYSGKSSENYDSIIKVLNYEAGEVVKFSDDVYCERLEEINKTTPFEFVCNDATLSTIQFFAEKRRGFTRVVLGRSELYFHLFEEKLSEYGLPLELKYLSVIESGLRPKVKSRAGALGLWQFMYGTGKMFGLKESTYIDERMDPDKATDAACRYLKQLYGIYGDWSLALAAYNAGPGNVNKAIRRSGNKTTYWEVRPFLPKETQGYVPNFIAAAYMMKYHAEHNIIPAEATISRVELDTMCISKGVHMRTIAELTGWEQSDIEELNPIYKKSYIPETNPKQCIRGPLMTIGKLVSLEDSLYALEDSLYHSSGTVQNNSTINVAETPTNTGGTLYHKVRSGETLGSIATKYSTSVTEIMNLNGLRSTNIYVGQRLKVNSSEATPSDSESTTPTPTPTNEVTKKYYSVRAGDTFSKIAQRHGKSISQLQRLNPGVNINRLSVGQRIRVR